MKQPKFKIFEKVELTNKKWLKNTIGSRKPISFRVHSCWPDIAFSHGYPVIPNKVYRGSELWEHIEKYFVGYFYKIYVDYETDTKSMGKARSIIIVGDIREQYLIKSKETRE